MSEVKSYSKPAVEVIPIQEKTPISIPEEQPNLPSEPILPSEPSIPSETLIPDIKEITANSSPSNPLPIEEINSEPKESFYGRLMHMR